MNLTSLLDQGYGRKIPAARIGFGRKKGIGSQKK
jgi:hypothetical protein